MKKNIQKDIQLLNQLSLVNYLNLLGFKATYEQPGSTAYKVMPDSTDETTITIDHATNRFTDKTSNRTGKFVDFVCLLFGITPTELCDNITPYRICQLMSETTPIAG